MKKILPVVFLVMMVGGCGEVPEDELLSEAFSLHRHAIETTRVADFEQAATAYQDYLEEFGDRTADKHLTFYCAEVLFRTGRWEEAAIQYDVVAQTPKSDHAKLAIIGAKIARQTELDYP